MIVNQQYFDGINNFSAHQQKLIVFLIEVNEAIRSHGVESVGKKLRGYMTDMKKIVESNQ